MTQQQEAGAVPVTDKPSADTPDRAAAKSVVGHHLVDNTVLDTGIILALMMYFGAVTTNSTTVFGDATTWTSSGGVGIGVGFGILSFWWVRRASEGRESKILALSLGLLSVVGFVLANSPVAFGILWVAVLALCFEVRVWVSATLAGGLSGMVFALHIYEGSPVLRAVGEAAFILFAVGMGIYFATLLKRVNQSEAERSRALQELEQANEQLKRRLATEQDLVLAEERARVAAALHDGLGHRLTSIGMSLDFSERIVTTDASRARDEIRHARTTATEALDEMRRAVRAMHPVVTDAQDPLGSIQALASSFDSTSLDVGFHRSGNGRPSREAGLLMVRFVQEALTNVVRHSGASYAELSVDMRHDAVISLQDNGSGSQVTTGYGIPSLQERAEAHGGSVTASPHGGISGGFKLELRLPGANQ